MSPSQSPFLIDMDGTLLDSTALVERAWTDFAARHGLDAAQVIAHGHGRPTEATTREFLGAGPDADREAEAVLAFHAEHHDGIREVAGAREFVRQLPRAGWALVTSATRQLATTRLRRIGIDLPAVCVFSEDITRGKPDPQPYELAAHRLGTTADACVVLEDSDAGVRSGMAAGARVVVVGSLTTFDGSLPRVADLVGLTPEGVRHLAG